MVSRYGLKCKVGHHIRMLSVWGCLGGVGGKVNRTGGKERLNARNPHMLGNVRGPKGPYVSCTREGKEEKTGEEKVFEVPHD